MDTYCVLEVVNNTPLSLELVPGDVHVNYFHSPAKNDIYNLGTIDANSSKSTPSMSAYGPGNSVIFAGFKVVTEYGALATDLVFNLQQDGAGAMTVSSCPSHFKYKKNISNDSTEGYRNFQLTFELND